MKTIPLSRPADFSLVVGGPLFQLLRRVHLSGDSLELPGRRILAIVLVTWLPLLLLSALEGRAVGGSVKIPFLADIESYVRFLVALPMLVYAELGVHRRISPMVCNFINRRIVVAEDLPRFNAALNSAVNVRNSFAAEMTLLTLVYTLGFWVWRNQIALGGSTWYGRPDETRLDLTLAGYWYVFVSIPMFQFILARWYMRLVLWFRFLWRVSRLNLHLTAAHPDRSGGIGFLGRSAYVFGPILFAQGTLLSGLIASRVLYEGQSLIAFKMDAAGLIGAMVLFVLGPLVMFTPQLLLARRQGFAEYGLLANRYVFGFEERWIRRDAPVTSDLLGSPDIQSLADLANSYSVVGEMRVVPFGVKDVTQLVAATAAPLLPLTLTMFSPEELLTRLVKILI